MIRGIVSMERSQMSNVKQSTPVSLDQPLLFKTGHQMKNRFMLAPLTNSQSHADGRLSDEEFHWLTLRAKGQFGLTMTCAAHVQAIGQGFPGQLGIFSDDQLDGHIRLAAAIKAEDSLAVAQLHHAGMRSPKALIGESPICPSQNAETGARAMSLAGVLQLRDDFVTAAVRAQRAGYDGVEIRLGMSCVSSSVLKRKPTITAVASESSTFTDGNRFRCTSPMVSRFLLGVRISPEVWHAA